MLYFAYGSNLLRVGMASRCPAAVALGPAVLPDHRLVFRRWADVEPCRGGEVTGALWRITPACESALDAYEAVADGLYRRVRVSVRPDGSSAMVEALLYRMTETHIAPPEPGYLATVLDGLRDFGLDRAAVLAAVDDASNEPVETR